MQNAVVVMQVLHALVALQVGVGLSGPYAEAEGELADKCHSETDIVSFFACHNRIVLYFLGAKIRISEQKSKFF